MPAKYYKTTFLVTVLSEDEPIAGGTSLSAIAYKIEEGDCVGKVERTSHTLLTTKEVSDACYEVGSEPSFFQSLSEKG